MVHRYWIEWHSQLRGHRPTYLAEYADVIYDDEGSGQIKNRKQKRELSQKQENALRANDLYRMIDIESEKGTEKASQNMLEYSNEVRKLEGSPKERGFIALKIDYTDELDNVSEVYVPNKPDGWNF